MSKILIIEDDVKIGNLEEEILSGEGFACVRAYSGTEALLVLKSETPDIIILDLMLPGMSGEDLLPHIKDIPVIAVSAKGSVDDRVDVLMKGAADFLVKPFSPKELVARVKVQLRKPAGKTNTYTFGNLSLNDSEHIVTVGGKPVSLTRTEYAVLKLLMQNPTQVFTKAVILDNLFEDTPDCTDSSLKTHISHLRAKLKAVDGNDYIEAVWGIGFKMADISTVSQPFA